MGVGAGEWADGAPHLEHEAALDGLRGLAVAAVVVFHLGHLEGGFLGVDLFFVLPEGARLTTEWLLPQLAPDLRPTPR